MQTILVTGGAGFIGSHTIVQLLEANWQLIIVDNLSNSNIEVLNRVKRLTGKTVDFVQGDIRDIELLNSIFSRQKIDAVIHFAGLKAVGESVEQPLRYYQNNVYGTMQLLSVMDEYDCRKLVFSSSATVYGVPETVPVDESAGLFATNPYGQSKLMVENILRDLSVTNPAWQISLLRYFNPVGAHPSGLIGEDPNGMPNNLMPYIAQVAVGKLDYLTVFGDDYPTEDGTGVRDYIHVMDLADAHLAALQHLSENHGCMTYNIGTGRGYSVLQMIQVFEKVSGVKVNYKLGERRAGDIAECYAKTELAEKKLGWKAKYGLEEMMRDQWKWQKENPKGYCC